MKRTHTCHNRPQGSILPNDGCYHLSCAVKNGEAHPVMLFNSQFKGELESGWLRFDLDKPGIRTARAKLYWAIKRECIKTGVYDLWKHWQAVVCSAVMPVAEVSHD